MTKKKKSTCVECRYCEERLNLEKGTRCRCARNRRVLPADVTSRSACGKFAPPKPAGHWGP